MTPAEQDAARGAAYDEMRDRWHRPAPEARWAGGIAQGARADPRPKLEPNLELLAAYIEPEDVVLDVGGGAGRIDDLFGKDDAGYLPHSPNTVREMLITWQPHH